MVLDKLFTVTRGRWGRITGAVILVGEFTVADTRAVTVGLEVVDDVADLAAW